MTHPSKVHESTSTIRGAGYEVTVQHYEPEAAGPVPTVIIIHGSHGLSFRSNQYRDMCQGLCLQGMAAALPHYFDSTATRISDHDSTLRHFKVWREVLHEAVVQVAVRPGVDAQRVGILGVSLGSILAISLAGAWEEAAPRLKAVVEYSGQLPKKHVASTSTLDWLRHCPPMLIMHGEEDRVIPVEEAFSLAAALSELSIPHEVQIYPEEGHRFEGPAEADALKRSLLFFQKHL